MNPPEYDQINSIEQNQNFANNHPLTDDFINKSFVSSNDYGINSLGGVVDQSTLIAANNAPAPGRRTPSSLAHYNLANTSNTNNNMNNTILNSSSISFDLLNANSNVLKTRYDVKSSSGTSSLYGSKVLLLFNTFNIFKCIINIVKLFVF